VLFLHFFLEKTCIWKILLIFALVKCVMHFMFVIFIIRLSGMDCPWGWSICLCDRQRMKCWERKEAISMKRKGETIGMMRKGVKTSDKVLLCKWFIT
jgi:hypothetical protein